MNGYFQLVATDKGTGLRLFPPTDGGEKINITDVTEYLQMKNVDVLDVKTLYAAISNLSSEIIVPLNLKPCLPEQEMFTVKVSDDRMTAIARFYPQSSTGSPISGKEEIIKDLKFKKVQFGIDEAAIDKYLASKRYCEDFIIAKGLPPVQGVDASIEYFFNTDLSTKPTRNEDGSVDFFHLNTINHCKMGDCLARLTREVPGKNGATVFGEILKPRVVKKLVLKYGNNIELSEDALEIYSKVNGHVCLTGGKVFVSDVYQVENVGTATGNVESEGSVLVNGNVQAGFSVKAKGNVEVKGVVEGASIECDGDIIIARGMNGMGKGELKAGGRVILKYAENATISAGAYVECESMLHCKVNAKSFVSVEGRKGFIAGGVVRATEKVSCRTLGSQMGADTLVEVGVDPESKKRFQELQKEMAETQKKIKSVQPVIMNMSQKLRAGEKLTPEQAKYFQSLAQANEQLMERINEIGEEIESLESAMRNEGQACVMVSGDAYPGTKIAIGDASIVLRKPAAYCRFIKDRGDVKMTAY